MKGEGKAGKSRRAHVAVPARVCGAVTLAPVRFLGVPPTCLVCWILHLAKKDLC